MFSLSVCVKKKNCDPGRWQLKMRRSMMVNMRRSNAKVRRDEPLSAVIPLAILHTSVS